jgi:chemotaxis protein MotA
LDLATVLGLSIALGALLGSVIIEGGHLGALVNIPAAVIVFGGTFGATVICNRLGDILKLPVVLRHAFFSSPHDPIETTHQMVELATLARRDGFLALDAAVKEIRNRFMVKGIQMMADGTAPETVTEVLETELYQLGQRHSVGAQILLTMGGLAPTLGVTGTVMGLVHMMSKIDDPSSMGPAIASAFLATLYGVASANVVFIPLGNKLKATSKREQLVCEIIIEGVRAIQKGASPIMVAESLKAFVTPKLRGQLEEARQPDISEEQQVEQQAKAS